MAYTTNPHMPRIRMEAVRLVKYRGWSTRKAARHFGFTHSAVVRWCKQDPSGGWYQIPTKSSRPHHHPKELSSGMIWKITTKRKEIKRSAEVVEGWSGGEHFFREAHIGSLGAFKQAQSVEKVSCAYASSLC